MYVQWGWIGGLGPMHSPLHTHTLHSYNTNQPPPHNHQPQPNVRLRNELRQKYPALYQLRLDTVAAEFEVRVFVR